MRDTNKLLGLEVLRFGAAFIVLLLHYHFLCDIGSRRSLPTVTFYPFYHSVPYLYAFAEWAVRIFWGISGYIFFWKYQPLIAGRTITFGDYAALRFARLYPLHLLTLVLVAAGQAVYVHLTGFHFLGDVHYSGPHVLAQIFMAGNRIFKGDSFNWPVWSVSLEIAVYVFFFAVSRFVTRSLWFNALVAGAFVAVRLIFPNTEFMGLMECLLFFYLGGAAAGFKRLPLRQEAARRFAWALAVILPLVYVLAAGPYTPGASFAFGCVWLPVWLYCLGDDWPLPEGMRRSIETLGNLTYASYLIHIPVLLLLAIISVRWKVLLPVFDPLFLASYLTLVLVLSFFIYRYFERPMKAILQAAVKRPGGSLSPIIISAALIGYGVLAFTPLVPVMDRLIPGPTVSGSADLPGTVARAHALFIQGRDAEALDIYDKVIADYPFDPIVYANRGAIYARRGDYDRALENLDRAIAINPNNFSAYNNRSVVYNARGRLDMALSDLRRAEVVDPCPDRFLSLKKRYRGIANYAMVADEVQGAICQESAQLYSNLGLFAIRNGDYNQAIGYFTRAILRDPQMGKAYGRRAGCYFKLKDYVRAREDVRQAIQLGIKVDPAVLNALR